MVDSRKFESLIVELKKSIWRGLMKSFPVGTVHNWNNGPHIKSPKNEWIPLKGEKLRAYYQSHPGAHPKRRKSKIKDSVKAEGEKHLKETGKGRKAPPQKFRGQRTMDKKLLLKLLDHGRFSIISAGRNIHREASAKKKDDRTRDVAYFEKRHEALREDLTDLKVPFIEIQGKYGADELSFIVLHKKLPREPKLEPGFLVNHMRAKESTEEEQGQVRRKLNLLGRKYNQDSVMHVIAPNKAYFRYTTKRPKKDPGIKTCASKKHMIVEDKNGVKSKIPFGEGKRHWKDSGPDPDYYTKVAHPQEAYTKFTFNLGHCP